MADDPRAPVTEGGRERVDVLRHRFLVVASLGLRRLTEAAQIRRDDGVCLRQLGHQRPPHVAVLGVAVQQDDWIASAGREVVQAQAVDLGKLAGDGGLWLS